MNTFMFDFNTGKTVTNPIEGITHFYVSPYVIPDVWAVLNLSDKIKIDNIDMDLVIEGRSKLPVIVMPFSILNLGKCMIKLNEDLGSGKICTGKKSIYFTMSLQANTICITNVH